MRRENISDAIGRLDERMLEPVVRLRMEAELMPEKEGREAGAGAEEGRSARQMSAGAEEGRSARQMSAGAEEERSARQMSARAEEERSARQISAGAEEERSVQQIGAGEEEERSARQMSAGAEEERSVQAATGTEGRQGSRRWLRNAAAAACLCVVCAGAALVYRMNFVPSREDAADSGLGMTGDAPMPGGAWVTPGEEPDEPEKTQPAHVGEEPEDEADAPGDAADAPGDVADASGDLYVTPESLFAQGAYTTESALMYQIIPVGDYQAFYEGIPSAESGMLEESLGGELADADGFYRLLGHDDLQYLISDNERADLAGNGNGRYSLWKFESFQTQGSYPYRDVLELIYGVERGDSIAKIVVMPPRFDNTEAGMRIQEEIGTYEVTDREQIESFYEIISGMTCYGSNHWEQIDYGSVDIPDNGEGGGEGIRKGRCLTLVTERGDKLDRLKYTAVSGMFYEYSGIAYEPLAAEQAACVEQVLGI